MFTTNPFPTVHRMRLVSLWVLLCHPGRSSSSLKSSFVWCYVIQHPYIMQGHFQHLLSCMFNSFKKLPNWYNFFFFFFAGYKAVAKLRPWLVQKCTSSPQSSSTCMRVAPGFVALCRCFGRSLESERCAVWGLKLLWSVDKRRGKAQGVGWGTQTHSLPSLVNQGGLYWHRWFSVSWRQRSIHMDLTLISHRHIWTLCSLPREHPRWPWHVQVAAVMWCHCLAVDCFCFTPLPGTHKQTTWVRSAPFQLSSLEKRCITQWRLQQPAKYCNQQLTESKYWNNHIC